MSCRVHVKRLPHARGLKLPSYASAGAAGADLQAAVDETVKIKPGERALVPTGLVLEIPHGFEGQVRPRSGLAIRHGLTLLNTPGTIDSDYRGEVKVILVNLGHEVAEIARGDRIAQLVLASIQVAEFEESDELATSSRGEGGFGSTGR
jgi:dUTP pyrophosphatase